MKVKFSKYEGAGNDFVLLDTRHQASYSPTQEQIAQICDRRFGVGADGLMMLGAGSDSVDFSMRYFNADGGQSTMCGNGGRCITRFADDLGIGGPIKHFSAIDGDHTATINQDGSITISMIDVDGLEKVEEGWLLNTGSPHLVVENRNYCQDQARALRQKYNANINYVYLYDTDPAILGTDLVIGITTYERGVEDETFACGTGATAAAIAITAAYGPLPTVSPEAINVDARGGRLVVGFHQHGDHFTNVTLTGPARKVFDGVLHI